MGSVWTSAEHQGRGPDVSAVITKGDLDELREPHGLRPLMSFFPP